MRQEIEDWKDLRFGMFIHWGLYALLGRGEWVMFNEAIDKDEYRQLMTQFTAEHFDARVWARTAKEAGMKYMVLTTRHHDGFSLWDSPASREQFDAMHSAAHRDFVREYVEACRAEGLKVGLYYSFPDWRFPGFFFPRMYRASAEDLRAQCMEQLRELLTNYGKIDILWFDGGEDYCLCLGHNLHDPNDGKDPGIKTQCPGFWPEKEIYEMARTLQPGIVVNNRCGQKLHGDFKTPEGSVGGFNVKEPWETCICLGGFWGWSPKKAPRSLKNCLSTLSQCATGDGNFLLNVGPRPDGPMDEDKILRLREIGDWLKAYGECIYGTRGGPWENDEMGGMTWRDNTLYIHIWEWEYNTVCLPKFSANILDIRALTTDCLKYESVDGHLTFTVDSEARNMPLTVIRIEFDENVGQMKAEGKWHIV